MQPNANKLYGWQNGMPMSLLEKLRVDLKAAMINKNSEVKITVRQIMAEFPKLTVPLTLESGKKTSRPKKPEEITDEDIQNVIRSLVKSEKTVLELTGADSSAYLEILETYLPPMASRAEIEDWIGANIDFSKLKSPMQAMGTIMKRYGKLADGILVKEILQEISKGK